MWTYSFAILFIDTLELRRESFFLLWDLETGVEIGWVLISFDYFFSSFSLGAKLDFLYNALFPFEPLLILGSSYFYILLTFWISDIIDPYLPFGKKLVLLTFCVLFLILANFDYFYIFLLDSRSASDSESLFFFSLEALLSESLKLMEN